VENIPEVKRREELVASTIQPYRTWRA